MIRFSVLILCLLICVGCGPQQVTVEDHQSTPVHIKLQPPVTIESFVRRGEPFESTYTAVPERVVAMWQNSIETIIALGAGDRIVAGMGIPDRKYVRPEYREAYDKIPYKDLKYANLESVLMMKPDLLVGWKSTFTNKMLQTPTFWQARQANVYILQSPPWGLNRRSPWIWSINIFEIWGVFLIETWKQSVSFKRCNNLWRTR